jgi:hypothetical protein
MFALHHRVKAERSKWVQAPPSSACFHRVPFLTFWICLSWEPVVNTGWLVCLLVLIGLNKTHMLIGTNCNVYKIISMSCYVRTGPRVLLSEPLLHRRFRVFGQNLDPSSVFMCSLIRSLMLLFLYYSKGADQNSLHKYTWSGRAGPWNAGFESVHL